MDAMVQLALAAMASQTFATEADKFLCFPALNPQSYEPDELGFASGTFRNRDDWTAFSTFSRTVNRIPRGPVYDADSDLLWDVYKEVLDQAECAAQSSPGGESAYREAMAYLYVNPDELIRQPNDLVHRYGELRDACIVAQEDYTQKKLAAEHSADTELVEKWRTVEEPRLRQRVADCAAAWERDGFKLQVEAAREIERTYAARQSVTTWSSWRARYMVDLDMPEDVHQNPFAGTSFTPGNIAALEDWVKFTLNSSDVTALAAGADPALRRVFAADTQPLDIERLSFEARSVGLDRPWFAKELLTSRFWRLRDPGLALSDGVDLSKGRCPAYIVGVIFARNVEVTRKTADPTTPVRFHIAARHLFDIATAVRMTPPAPSAPKPPTPSRARFLRREHAGILHSRAAEAVRAAPGAGRTAVFHPGLLMAEASVVGSTPVAPPPSTEPDKTITILAFICRRVPKSPDPDETLSWPT